MGNGFTKKQKGIESNLSLIYIISYFLIQCLNLENSFNKKEVLSICIKHLHQAQFRHIPLYDIYFIGKSKLYINIPYEM